ncbi:hypothetical protein JTE88_08560 [Arcanobacterium phocisimile]|uniref:Uncharacterized protein n=1 Tax=Arcanobacterium phocisimile TaxID=1302235 RepID=A0ABX7IGZ6_9ACTO|nr:hypothetical protein [Arcanobacterium phocisimile]QRV02110.1 hypothetical protein JTE88_08560 [Arcanobacterium phocisimile]
MQIWTLEHPIHGHFEIVEAPAVEMRKLDPEWDAVPDVSPADETSNEALDSKKGIPETGVATPETGTDIPEVAKETSNPNKETEDQRVALKNLADRFERWSNRLPRQLNPVKERLSEYTERIRSNVGNQVAIRLNGRTLARYYRPRSGTCGLRAFLLEGEASAADGQAHSNDGQAPTDSDTSSSPFPAPGEFAQLSPARKPKITLEASPFGDIISAYYVGSGQSTNKPATRNQSADDIFEFTAPPNSYAEKRLRMLESSPLKRLFLPILIGLSKVGWAWFAVLFFPIVKAVLEPVWDSVKLYVSWLFFPLAWLWTKFWWLIGKIWWPIGWLLRKIWWPIGWLLDTLGSLLKPLKDAVVQFFAWLSSFFPPLPDLPDWLAWLVGHPKLWLPVVTGIAFGILSFIRYRRARRTRNSTQPNPEQQQIGE